MTSVDHMARRIASEIRMHLEDSPQCPSGIECNFADAPIDGGTKCKKSATRIVDGVVSGEHDRKAYVCDEHLQKLKELWTPQD